MYFEEALMVARCGVKVAKKSWDRELIDCLYYGDSEDGSDNYIGFYMKMRNGDNTWVHHRLESVAGKLKIQGYFDEWYIINANIDESRFDFPKMRKDLTEKIEGMRAIEKLENAEKALKVILEKLERASEKKQKEV